jgi:DNA-binding transcriptional MerR regulator
MVRYAVKLAMPKSSSMPATRIDLPWPTLHGQRAGYVLGDRYVEGFADDLALDLRGRWRIAHWAQTFGHELDDAQRALLELPEPVDPIGRELLYATSDDIDLHLPLAGQFGLYDRLTEDELLLAREPWRRLGGEAQPGEERRDYPINVTELAKVAGVTPKQVREWEKAGLLPAAWVDGRRQFFSAAVVHAFALRQLSRFQIAALANVLAAEDDDDVFIQLIEHTLAARRSPAARGVLTSFTAGRVDRRLAGELDP